MSDAPTAPQSPPPADPPPVPRRLTRSSSDKVLAGVAGGLGRYFDIDPIIFRIGFVVLVFAGGAGILAYLAAWVLVPDDPVPGQAPADRSRAATIAGGAVLAFAAIVLLGHGWFFLAPPLIGLGLIAIVGVLLWRAAGGERGGTAAAKIGLALLLIVVTVLGFVAVAFGAALGGGAVIAGVVIALGGALVISSFLGGRRWLVLPALVIAIPLGFVAAAGLDVNGGVGERDYQPTTVAELEDGYQLGIGQMRVDLTHVDLPPGRTPLELDMGVGSVRLFVPDDVCVASDVRVGAGYARVLDRDNGGLDVDWRQSPVEGPGVKRLVIHGDVGVGELQVVNSQSSFTDWEGGKQVDNAFDRSFDFGRNRVSDLSPGVDANAACKEAA
jgi:phage shock protein PspC (stress-responsive transcriptional regulator)